MVKGLSRRVVVVRFPDTRVFEQAIFVLREDNTLNNGVSAEDIVKEACSVAEGYVKKPKKFKPPIFYTGLGVAGTGILWLLFWLVKVF